MLHVFFGIRAYGKKEIENLIGQEKQEKTVPETSRKITQA